jgi:hypothetical protein
MLTFDFPYHRVRTEYPDSTTKVQMGKGWVYPVKPDAPDQRRFVLTMDGMQYFVDPITGEISSTINPQRNMLALELFYRSVQCWGEFNYVHPIYGATNVRFNIPLSVPQGIKDANGLLEPFELSFIEIPKS